MNSSRISVLITSVGRDAAPDNSVWANWSLRESNWPPRSCELDAKRRPRQLSQLRSGLRKGRAVRATTGRFAIAFPRRQGAGVIRPRKDNRWARARQQTGCHVGDPITGIHVLTARFDLLHAGTCCAQRAPDRPRGAREVVLEPRSQGLLRYGPERRAREPLMRLTPVMAERRTGPARGRLRDSP